MAGWDSRGRRLAPFTQCHAGWLAADAHDQTLAARRSSPPESPWQLSTGWMAGQTWVGGKGCCPAQIMAGVMAAPARCNWGQEVRALQRINAGEPSEQALPRTPQAPCLLPHLTPAAVRHKTCNASGPTDVQIGGGAGALALIHDWHGALRKLCCSAVGRSIIACCSGLVRPVGQQYTAHPIIHPADSVPQPMLVLPSCPPAAATGPAAP